MKLYVRRITSRGDGLVAIVFGSEWPAWAQYAGVLLSCALIAVVP